ncbi:MAG TPA: WXG100 family type VII secretion target [Anaerolineae bacterium]|nr:WXG100 family type VII secretion target [Anaerolineae bacterium]
MLRIQVDPDELRALGAQLERISQELRNLADRVNRAWNGLDWEVRQKAAVGGQVSEAFGRAHALARQAMTMAGYLLKKAQVFEEADREGAQAIEEIIRRYPSPPSPRSVIEVLEDLLSPIDWASDHRKARRIFLETLRQIGRLLNSLTGRRGHIKLMEQLGALLTGTAKGVSSVADLYKLADFRAYFAGEMTNREIARSAIEALVPIPFLDDKIAEWISQNVPDPNGHWKGFIRQAGG